MKKLTSCFDNLSIANRLAVMYALVATVVLSVIVVVLYILKRPKSTVTKPPK
ncbi:MAG: hypothetical protein ACLU99_13635 [Alphaproteobacteria bacterium]